MPERLTAPSVAKATTRPSRYEIADSLQPGLRLVVQPSGAKSWAFRYERSDGQRVKVTLGRAAGPGALTLQQARNAANDARRLRSTGGDPADQRRTEKRAEAARIEAEEREARRKDDTVENVLGRYFADHADHLKSGREIRRVLTRELQGWARRRIDDVGRGDAIRLLDTVKARAPVQSKRLRAYGRHFFGWCMRRELCAANPFDGTAAIKEVPRDRILNDDELRLLSMAITRLDWPWRQFFTLAMMTGQRREECAGMRWSEIDLIADHPIWVLPSSRTKNSREHAVPLSLQVIAVLKSIDRVQTSDIINGVERTTDSSFVFTTTGRTSISGFSDGKERLDATMLEIARKEAIACGGDPDAVAIAPWRIHDLRRTAASGMARLGVSVPIVEKVLNHVSGTFGGIVGVYQRHDFLAEKRHALNLWAEHVASLTTERESNVVRLKMGD